MLYRGYQIESVNEQKHTCLHCVSILGRTAVVSILLDKISALKASAQEPTIDYINLKDNQGKTPLILASERSREPTVKLLLEANADVNARDNQGNTPLYYACQARAVVSVPGQPSIAKQLVEAGADLHATNNAGQSPLDLIPNLLLRAVDKENCINELNEAYQEYNHLGIGLR